LSLAAACRSFLITCRALATGSRATTRACRVYTLDGRQWLINVLVEPEFPEDMAEQLADDLADTGIEGATPGDYPVLVNVTIEPVTRDDDALSLQMAILDMLVETCDGIVMAN